MDRKSQPPPPLIIRYAERSGFAKDDVQTVSTILAQSTQQQIENGDSPTPLSRLTLESITHMCEQHPHHPGWASALKDCLTLLQKMGGGKKMLEQRVYLSS